MRALFHVILLMVLALNVNGESSSFNETNSNWLSFDNTVRQTTAELLRARQTLNLGIDDAIIVKSSFVDQLGFKHSKTQQTYKGLPVEGAGLIVHEKENKVNAANGQLIKNLNINIVPKISTEQAFTKTLTHLNAVEYAWQNEAYEQMLKKSKQNDKVSFYPTGALVIFNPEFDQASEKYKLAYKFDVFAVTPFFRKWVYVDANTGSILKSINKIHTCNHQNASGNTNYSGQVTFNACSENNKYHLKSEQNALIEIFNANRSDTYLPIGFEENNNQFNNNPSAVEVFSTLQKAYNYFDNIHSFTGISNSSAPVLSWVNYKENFNNAFWNGTWLTFGEGDGENYGPYTSPDIVAHEYMHSITDYSAAQLAYYGESGALNESFSDIFGEVIEHHINGTNDWIIGTGVPLQAGKTGLRNMADPNSSLMTTQQPAAYKGPYWYNGFADNGGVHINSGVQNHWFYLLSEGGEVTNFKGKYFEIEGINIENAAEIVYLTLTSYLTENATYLDAYYGSIQAATSIFGHNSNEVQQVKAAWCAVNVGNSCVTNIDPTTCNKITDSLALVALYNSTNGNAWYNQWNLNNPLNTWHGITENSKGCVLYIDLHNNNLTGTLPTELGNLKHVKRLRLSNSYSATGKIGGFLPSTIGEMENLEILNISYHNLEGNMPGEWSNLKNLNTLNLAGNNLSGNLPVFLNNLTALQEIDLASNSFSGNLPDLTLLQTLITFDLGFNDFTGTIPASFANLFQLEWLNVKNNDLSGCFPGSLATLCSHLSPLFSENAWINDGNNFNENWEDFCLTGAGSCNGKSIVGPVYPGDFNQNGLVEISDLLYWGLAFEETGASRPIATNSFIAQDCIEWQNSINNVNNKHQDANGDGIVNKQDISVFIQNYDLGTLNNSTNQSTSPIKFILEPINSIKVADSTKITYELRIESLSNQPVTANGLACNINFNNLPVTSIDVDFENTSLDQIEYLSIYDINNNKLNIALTKKNRIMKVFDNEVVGVITIVLDEVQSGEPYIIAINNGNIMSNIGQLSSSINQTIYGILSLDQTATPAFTTQVQTTDEQCNTLGSAVADAVGGVPPYNYSWSNGGSTAEINNLPAGSYTVTISDANNNSNTINIEIGAPQPVFDYQTGEQLCGQDCSDNLNLDGTVNGGYYKAAQHIESNATLNTNSQIQFKAGDRIRLTSGFSTSQSQKFSATIGNCND